MSSELLRRIHAAQVEAGEDAIVEDLRRKGLLPPKKTAIAIDLDHLRQLMAEFVAEISSEDPTAYTIPFETFLQWLQQRQKKERGNAS